MWELTALAPYVPASRDFHSLNSSPARPPASRSRFPLAHHPRIPFPWPGNSDDNSYKPSLINPLTQRAFYAGFYGSTNYEPGTKSHTVLMHDTLQKTVRNLAPWVVRQAKALGFKLVTVGECQGEVGWRNWYLPVNGQPKPAKFDNKTWICPEDQKPPRCLPWEDRCLRKSGARVLGKPWK